MVQNSGKYNPYGADGDNIADILGARKIDDATLVETGVGLSRSWRPPFILSPVVEQRIRATMSDGKDIGIPTVLNPISPYQRRYTRYNLWYAALERISKEFSKQKFVVFVDGNVQGANTTDPHILNYVLKVAPNKVQTFQEFLYRFCRQALKSRKAVLYIDKTLGVMMNLPPDFCDEYGRIIDEAITDEYRDEFYDIYGVRFQRKNVFASLYRSAGESQINWNYYWLDIEGLLSSLTPQGIVRGHGRMRPQSTQTQHDPMDTYGMQRLNELNSQFATTGRGFLGTEESYQELFTNRASTAEIVMQNQLKLMQLTLGISEDVLKGDLTTEQYHSFLNMTIQPLVKFFCNLMTQVWFTKEACLRGSEVRQDLFQPTPFDLGIMNQTNLLYDARMSANEYRGNIGLSTDNELLDEVVGNLNQQPLNRELFDKSRAENELARRAAELKLELMEADHSIALESQRRVSISNKGTIDDSGDITGLISNTDSVFDPENPSTPTPSAPPATPVV